MSLHWYHQITFLLYLLIKVTIAYFVCEHEFFVCVPQYLLLNEVCCSLVNKSTAPGQKDWDSEKSVWTRIMKLAKEISVSDPEFLLKVGIHVCKSWFVSFFIFKSGLVI